MTSSPSPHIIAIGLNHHSAPIDIRERFAFAPDQLADAMQTICALPEINEVVIVNTCNRMEVYLATAITTLPATQIISTLLDWLHQRFGCEQRYDRYFQHWIDQQAIVHLLRVNGGLDSMVLGEPQISGQVKEAHRLSANVQHPDADTDATTTVMGSVLNRLFQCAFRCSKDIRTNTELSRHPVTVPYATLALAQQIFADLRDNTLLLLGAGDMIKLCARHFATHPVKRIIIVNRNLDKAKKLAAQIADRIQVEARGLTELQAALHEADILISSTASQQPLITKAMVSQALKLRRHQPMLMVDIAVPRDIAPNVNDLPDAYLYTIDDLTSVLDANRKQRANAAQAAELIVADHTEQFLRWLNLRRAGRHLQRFREHAHQQEQLLLERARQQLSHGVDPEQVLTTFSHQLVQRLLHTGTLKLRHAAEAGDQTLIEELQDLFKLQGVDLDKLGASSAELSDAVEQHTEQPDRALSKP